MQERIYTGQFLCSLGGCRSVCILLRTSLRKNMLWVHWPCFRQRWYQFLWQKKAPHSWESKGFTSPQYPRRYGLYKAAAMSRVNHGGLHNPRPKRSFFLGANSIGRFPLGGLGPLDILDSHDTCLLHQLASSTQHPALSHTGVVWAPPASGQIQERLRLRRDDLPNFQGSRTVPRETWRKSLVWSLKGGHGNLCIYIYI